MSISVASLGPAHTFSHLAALEYFNNETVEFQFHNQIDTCRKVTSKQVDFGVLPVENMTGGFVWETFDAMHRTSRVNIVDEIYLRVDQNLMSNVERLEDITTIYSHGQAFRQCRGSIDRLQKEIRKRNGNEHLQIEQITVSSTTRGAVIASLPENRKHSAAIGSIAAAKHYGLSILLPKLHDDPMNFTRFWVVSQRQSLRTASSKTVFLVELPDSPGALQRFLKVFSDEIINLRWLQLLHIRKRSRPTYIFYFEFSGHVKCELERAYAYLKRAYVGFESFRLLGSFPDKTPNWLIAKQPKMG